MSAPDIDTRIAAAVTHLNDEVRLIDDTGQLDQAIVDTLLDAGLPLARLTTGVPSLHPNVDSFSTVWERGKGLSFRQFRVTPDNEADLQKSPIFDCYQTGESVRCGLEGPPGDDRYPIMAELRAAGLTDYAVIPLPFSDGSNKALSIGTDRPGGFDDDDVAFIKGVRHAIAGAIEVRYLRHMAQTLMDTYVGPIAGRRVLDGEIRRGSGETIRAVIWFCDIKGFTPLSESLATGDLLATLDTYFEAVTAAIEAGGGEVLKFIGDAVLAIFPDEDGHPRDAAAAALDAARAAQAELARVNTARAAGGQPPVECGIALHFGDVVYGNIGGANRLDFTVIGPAVNLASRIEGLTRQVEGSLVVSEAFADLHGGEFADLGRFELKGIADKARVFAPKA